MKVIKRILIPILLVVLTLFGGYFLQNRTKSCEDKVLFIINPKSGTHDKEQLEKLIHHHFKEARIAYTQGPHHATALSKKAARRHYRLVVAVGGDGTVNEVGKGLVTTKTALGIIPSGSGNGLARHLEIPTDPKKALHVLKEGHGHKIDVVTINKDVFFGVAGIGFDAHIAQRFAHKKKRGFAAYAQLVLKEYHRYVPKTYEMVIDGKKLKREGFLISFANSSQYGNNMMIAPQAKIDDGFLQLAILKAFPNHAAPKILYRLRHGTLDHSKYYESYQCKKIECSSKMKMS